MTISDEYRKQQMELHENPNYGMASVQYAPLVAQLLEKSGAKTVADYGAGKCHLRNALHELGHKNFEYFPYDPAFPDYGKPKPAELVCCIDVLEHIEPEFLESVLNDLAKITRHAGFFTIHMGPAVKTLPDGRNAHLIQQPTSWWLPKLCERFEIVQLQQATGGFWVIVTPRMTA